MRVRRRESRKGLEEEEKEVASFEMEMEVEARW
jgi:hypothetical protein